jgi:hypothetical protein
MPKKEVEEEEDRTAELEEKVRLLTAALEQQEKALKQTMAVQDGDSRAKYPRDEHGYILNTKIMRRLPSQDPELMADPNCYWNGHHWRQGPAGGPNEWRD